MVETVLSIVGVLACWCSAWILGYIVGKEKTKDDPIKMVKLDNGDEIHMWKGFIDPTKVIVSHIQDKNGNYLEDGDGVIFDEKGNIIETYINETT